MADTVLDIIIRIIRQGSTDADIKKLSTSLSDLGSAASRLGKGLTVGVTAPLTALAGVAVNAASDTSESLSKMQVVFGDTSGVIAAFTKDAAKNLGMSRQDALEAAGTFGNLFKTMGVGKSETADMSQGLVQLAADLASFNNIDPTEALVKLRAGLVGEAEPLRTLGVNLSAAAVEARVLEMGLAKTKDEITDSMRVSARYALIMEQTTTAQGDFARTSDGLANSSRVLKAQLADAAATLGQQLLPIALRVVTALNSLVEKFTALDPSMQGIIVVVGAIAAALGPLLVMFGSVATAITALTPLWPAIAAAIGAVAAPVAIVVAAVAALVIAWNTNFLGIRDKTTELWAALQPVFQSIGDWLQTNIPAAIQALVVFWNGTLMPAFQTAWKWILENLIPLFQAVGNVLSAVVGLAVTALAALWQNILLPALQGVWAFVSENLMPIFTALATLITDVIAPVISGLANGALASLRGAFDGIGGAIQGAIGWLNNLADKIRGIKLPDWLVPGGSTPAVTVPSAAPVSAGTSGGYVAPSGITSGGVNLRGGVAGAGGINIQGLTINVGNGNPTLVRESVMSGLAGALRARGAA
jgi:hypothetical protein